MAQLKDLIVTGTSRFLGNIYGNLKGNADTATSATKATQDASGNVITSTYAKQKDLTTLSNLVGGTAVSSQISTAIAKKSDTGHTHDDRYYTESEINSKLSGKSDTGHTHSSYVNQNAFSNVVVGSTTVAADSATDTLTLVAGSNVTLTPDATNDKITIAATNTTYSNATTSAAGLMSSSDKSKLNGIAAGANKTTVDSALSSTSTNPVQNKVVNTAISNLNSLVGDTIIRIYTHSKKNNVHNFVGTGANGRAKITADFASGDTFQVNGTAVTAYWGADAPDADLIAKGRWVTFIVDGNTINFKPGGGLSSTKLAQATASADDVISGKSFYAGDKTLKTGNLVDRGSYTGAASVHPNGSDTIYVRIPFGAYRTPTGAGTPEIIVPLAQRGGESKTITPSTSAQSCTFATSGYYCSGNMTVSVPAATIHSTSWPMRSDIRESTMNLESRNIGVPDGAGTYAWTATCGTWNGNANSPVEFHFMGNDYSVKYGNAQNFCFSGINYFDSSTTYTGRQWGGWLWFYYVRLY